MLTAIAIAALGALALAGARAFALGLLDWAGRRSLTSLCEREHYAARVAHYQALDRAERAERARVGATMAHQATMAWVSALCGPQVARACQTFDRGASRPRLY